jgi:uncharacterized membrane protein (Fun14 family)
VKNLTHSQIVLQVSSSATSTLIQLFGPAAAELGFSGILGYVLGYALKKILKLIIGITAIFAGIQIGFLYWLQRIGAINVTINYDKLASIGTNAVTWGTSQLGSLAAFASTISLVGTGFVAGAALGFERA